MVLQDDAGADGEQHAETVTMKTERERVERKRDFLLVSGKQLV